MRLFVTFIRTFFKEHAISKAKVSQEGLKLNRYTGLCLALVIILGENVNAMKIIVSSLVTSMEVGLETCSENYVCVCVCVCVCLADMTGYKTTT
jgi:hypothetical protein